MQYREAQLRLTDDQASRCRAIPGHTPVREAAEHPAFSIYRYLLVENERHELIGVLSKDSIKRYLGNSDGNERRKRGDVPVEYTLAGRIDCFSEAAGNGRRNSGAADVGDATLVFDRGAVVGVVTNDEFFVRWQSVESTLQRAQLDHVTSLPGRSVFQERLSSEFNRARRSSKSLAVVIIDVDYFKETNDQYGHSTGDDVLRAIGHCLRSRVRSYDCVARIGGDEFAILAGDFQPGEIESLVCRLQNGVEQLTLPEHVPCEPPTVSIGAAVAHAVIDLASPEAIVQSADECLYIAKRSGRNCSFTTEMGVQITASEPRQGHTPSPSTESGHRQRRRSTKSPFFRRRTDAGR